VDDARAKGAVVADVGKRPETAVDRPRTLAPVLVLGATDDMAIMQEEIFGPVLPVLTYDTIDGAIAWVNAHPRPLALYYFGGDDAVRRKVLSRTTSGTVGINSTLMHYAQDDLPFGGVGASGMGAYHGIEGFRRLSHAKGIYVQGRWNAADLMRAPFGRLADAVLRVMLR
jgi:coniferyl-aldehyde dehydrogenase